MDNPCTRVTGIWTTSCCCNNTCINGNHGILQNDELRRGQQTCNDVNSRFVFPTGTILGTDDIVSILAPGHDVCVLEEAFEYIRAYPGFLVVKPRKRDGVYWPHMDSRLRSAGQDALVYTVFYDFDSARTVWSSIGIDEPRIPHFRVMDFSPCNFDMQRELEEREDE